MKNIHILPTDKPSRLRYFDSKLEIMSLIPKKSDIVFQNIYITSDEEIKEGDWYLNIEEKNGIKNPFYGKLYKANQSICQVPLDYLVNNLKKIILTTDPTLIADGVQAIDDEFLEWFVKNPSCEFVELQQEILKLVHNPNYVNHTSESDGIYLTPINEDLQYGETVFKDNIIDYKIIIPQEEFKQETLEEAAKLYIGVPITRIIDDEERYYTSNIGEYDAFIQGAKWQQERMYSEEDMKKCWNAAYIDALAIDEETYKPLFFEDFIKQHKKK